MESMLPRAWSILGREALRIVLPSWCVVCERELPWRERTASCCRTCWARLPKITAPKCLSCALPWDGLGEIGDGPYRCLDCIAEPLPLEWCEAWGSYRDVLERLVGAFKFERHDFLDVALASLLHETLRERGDLSFDAVVPVPMTAARERRRGYNQAELLARALGRATGLRCEPPLLVARRERSLQSRLTRAARAANVRGAYDASPAARGRSILIVDDICTTGETFRACAAALRRRGAARVCAVAVAKAT